MTRTLTRFFALLALGTLALCSVPGAPADCYSGYSSYSSGSRYWWTGGYWHGDSHYAPGYYAPGYYSYPAKVVKYQAALLLDVLPTYAFRYEPAYLAPVPGTPAPAQPAAPAAAQG